MGTAVRISARNCLTCCIILLFTATSVRANCNYVELVKCFITVLDEWAFVLYQSKENIVTIVEHDGCQHYDSIRKCVEDTAATKHNCNRSEIMEASRTVSDLLTHRRHSGTFLKSYYLVEYSCGKGKETVMSQLECLKQEKIGPETLEASSYLDRKLHHGLTAKDPYSVTLNSDEACAELQDRLAVFQEIITPELCDGIASSLMCKSLYDMFKNVYPDVLGSCQYDCDKKHQLPSTEEPEKPPKTNGAAGQTGQKPIAGGGTTETENTSKGVSKPAISFALMISAWFLVLTVNKDLEPSRSFRYY